MIKVIYKCICMVGERTIEVPIRPPGSDLMLWMRVVESVIAMDHAATSPRCSADTMEYAKIPLADGAEGVGEQPSLQ
jgi:hypothetical protein